jgi:purine-binding chemotaxis protein CheW
VDASSASGEEGSEPNEPPPAGPTADDPDGTPVSADTASAATGPDDEPDGPESATDDDDDDAGSRDGNTLQVLEFALSGATYAVTIGEVGAIVEMKEITRFPRGPGGVDGVTDLRGEITAVLDPKQLLDIPTDEGPTADDYIVVLERDGEKQKVAIRVDEVVRVETYPDDRIDHNGDLQSLEVESLAENMVDGIVHKESEAGVELVPWLNIDAMVANVG